jgi:hypothetical protein
MVPHPPDADTGIELGDIGIEVEALDEPEVLDVPEVAGFVLAACVPDVAAFDELELELPHAASVNTLSRRSPAPPQRVPITRPSRNISNPLLSNLHSHYRCGDLRIIALAEE